MFTPQQSQLFMQYFISGVHFCSKTYGKMIKEFVHARCF